MEYVTIVKSWPHCSYRTLNLLPPETYCIEWPMHAVFVLTLACCGCLLNGVQKVVYLARQRNLEVDGVFVQELLDSPYQELTIDELMNKDIGGLQSLDPVQSEDRMMVGQRCTHGEGPGGPDPPPKPSIFFPD
ncbi:hypothetical protein TNCV_2477531 [Trichonephila clavipes]|nr:hypothetical protein TNCV_2477531 [Trichonephila clavipes]